MQNILTASENYTELDEYFKSTGTKKILLVCDNSIGFVIHNNRSILNTITTYLL